MIYEYMLFLSSVVIVRGTSFTSHRRSRKNVTIVFRATLHRVYHRKVGWNDMYVHTIGFSILEPLLCR
jgi:hypothetical protein